MNLVWERAPVSGNELLMLLAIADFADDDGCAWPSVRRLATKTRIDERTARRVVHRLVGEGLLTVTAGGGRGNTNLYRIGGLNPGVPPPLAERPPSEASGGHPKRKRGASDTPNPGTSAPRTIEPSEEPVVCAARDMGAPVPDVGPDQGHPHAEAVQIVDAWSAAHPAAKSQTRTWALDVVATALKDGTDAGLIRAALARLAADGFIVTNKTLAVAIAQITAGTARARRYRARSSVADATATPAADPDDVGAYLAALRAAPPASSNGDVRKGTDG